jgi:pimeloyl-ACP methyl ester carboxylesterase
MDLSQRSPNGRLIVAEKSGHNIQVDQPELVTEAIRDVVAATRARVR